MLIARVGADYLLRQPPCFLGEPFEVRWLLSNCDTRLHSGTIYGVAGFERYRANADGVGSWRVPLPALSAGEGAALREAARVHPRSIMHRERRALLALGVA